MITLHPESITVSAGQRAQFIADIDVPYNSMHWECADAGSEDFRSVSDIRPLRKGETLDIEGINRRALSVPADPSYNGMKFRAVYDLSSDPMTKKLVKTNSAVLTVKNGGKKMGQ